ncbi:MAG: FAD-dependent oxidoreductase [Candidatus Gastranaerophilales bacterium]|nr:FAD-dependent oxidoreductase [Candidatus Gastranaerophilales bacterium]
MNLFWDVIVVGGGASGVAAAVSASEKNCKTLLIEQNSFLGGSATASLVTPMMKNGFETPQSSLTQGLYKEILNKLYQTGDSAIHENGNIGWFNPEIMKCALDDMCIDSGVSILFNTFVSDVKVKNDKIVSLKCINKSGEIFLKAKYFIDATGDADIANLAKIPCEIKDVQALSLRLNISNLDMDKFTNWMRKIDSNPDTTSICTTDNGQLLVTTAYTSENKDWKLKPYFEKGIKEGIITEEDAEYFQIFSIPGQPGTMSFNCPRIAMKNINPLNVEDTSKALVLGRQQIRRMANFCKKYFIGFEDAFISQIAPQLGVRSSRRIEGKYKLTEDDILSCKKFDSAIAKSNYPIDIHSKDSKKNELNFIDKRDYYEIPLETMLNNKIANLIVVGKAISSTFKAQASLRIQPNCWATGEAAGRYVADELIRHMF